MEYLPIKKLKSNPNNPRTITDENFEKLVKSIKDFPKMLEMRPIVTNEDFVVLGGNMRLKACLEAGLKKVPHFMFTEAHAIEANKKTGENKTYQEYCDEFIIKDNVGFGDWDWAALNGEDWDKTKLNEWGLAMWDDSEAVDIEEFFEDDTKPTKAKNKIVLEYSEADFETITNKLDSLDGSKEKIIWDLLGLTK